jgi:hypothetical protein
MEQSKMSLNLDISKTSPVLTKTGGKIWQQGFIIRKASRFLIGSDEDQIIPIPVFYDPESGEISREGMPDNMSFLFEDESEE